MSIGQERSRNKTIKIDSTAIFIVLGLLIFIVDVANCYGQRDRRVRFGGEITIIQLLRRIGSQFDVACGIEINPTSGSVISINSSVYIQDDDYTIDEIMNELSDQLSGYEWITHHADGDDVLMIFPLDKNTSYLSREIDCGMAAGQSLLQALNQGLGGECIMVEREGVQYPSINSVVTPGAETNDRIAEALNRSLEYTGSDNMEARIVFVQWLVNSVDTQILYYVRSTLQSPQYDRLYGNRQRRELSINEVSAESIFSYVVEQQNECDVKTRNFRQWIRIECLE
jgi:hypothetical protein